MKSRLTRSFILLKAIPQLLLLGICVSTNCLSQPVLSNINAAPTPNTAVLLKDYNIPINYYLGRPSISVPLYTFQHVGLEVPIGLSYDASGMRIDQEATWAGLGWDLTCGGVIVRRMRGGRDEFEGKGYARPQLSPWQWNPAAFDDITSTTSFVGDANADQVVYKLRNGLDTQPDEFYFTINGRTGKFYLDQSGNPITDDKVTISYTLEPVSGSSAKYNLFSFTVIDELGIKYKFGPRELQAVGSYYSGAAVVPAAESSEYVEWYMESMETPDGLSKINFEYDLTYQSPFSTWQLRTSSEQFKILTLGGTVYKIYDYNISQITQGMIFLSRIYTDNEEVVFDKTPYSGRLRAKLDKIRIRNRITGQEWFYKFYSSDFGISKFLLDAIYRVSGPTQEAYYQFAYNLEPVANAYGDCQVLSYTGIDHWGYNNGSRTYQSRIPSGETMYNYQNLPFVPISSRNPSTSATRPGSLESITLPTKGRINFEYENHDYGYVGATPLATTKTAGGLRIKKIVYKDDDDETNDVAKIFTYQSESNPSLSSGAVPFEPVYNFNYVTSTFACNNWVNNPILPLSIGYSQVTEINSDGSKVVYRFNSAKEYPPTSDPGDIQILYHSIGTGNGPQDYKRNTDSTNPYFKSDNVNTHMRGTLRDKLIFDNLNNKIQEVHYDYSSWVVGKLLSISQFWFDLRTNGGGNYSGFPNSVTFLLKNYIHVSRYEVSGETVKTYKPNDASSYFATSKNHTFNANYFVKETSETRSDNKIMKYLYTYPTDYNTSTMGGNIGSLLSLQAKGLPIETLKTVNGKIIQGNITEYDNLARPIKNYSLETEGSITYTPSLLNPSNHISLPSNYKEKYSYTFNTDGRLVQQDEYGFKTSWLWGYSNSKVIAKAENAPFNNAFYSSFEENGTPDIQAKTGLKSINTPYVFLPPPWLSAMPTSKLSYWYWNGQWNFRELPYAGGNVTISEGSKIDDLRIHPSGAMMTTYTHDVNKGITSGADVNGRIKSYEYDNFGRISRLRDNNLNLITQFTYNYKN